MHKGFCYFVLKRSWRKESQISDVGDGGKCMESAAACFLTCKYVMCQIDHVIPCDSTQLLSRRLSFHETPPKFLAADLFNTSDKQDLFLFGPVWRKKGCLTWLLG